MLGNVDHDQLMRSSFRYARELPPDIPPGMTLRTWRRRHAPRWAPLRHRHRSKHGHVDRGNGRRRGQRHPADPTDQAIQAMVDWQARVGGRSIYR